MAYLSCKHLSRTKPSFEVDKEKTEEISKSYRTLPVFETILYDDVYRQHYSLETNEFLRCRWDEFKDKVATRGHEPFKFYDQRDLHFYLNCCCLVPSQSIYNKTNFRKTMNAAAIVDALGPKPLPADLHVRKFSLLSRKWPKRYPKDAKDDKKDK